MKIKRINKLKKVICISLLLIFCVFLLVGCNNTNIKFIRFDIKQINNNQYIFDFILKVENTANYEITLNQNDFYVKVNETEFNSVTFLYENEETFYGKVLIEKKNSIKLRARIITTIIGGDFNSICLKYKNKIIVEDKVYISTTKN